MFWIYGPVGALLAVLLLFAIRFIISIHEKKEFVIKKNVFASLIDFVLAYVSSVLTSVIAVYSYASFSLWNVFAFGCSVSLLLAILSPGKKILSLIDKGGSLNYSWVVVARDLCFLLVYLLELFLFNNIEKSFVFSSFRFLCFSLLIGFFFNIPKNISLLRNEEDQRKKGKHFIIGLCIVLFFSFVVIVMAKQDEYLTTYPFDSTYTSDNPFLYYNLFSAFLHGHLYLDEEPSSALMALSNPYDPSLRAGISYLWDTVYYGGKYYCYYGPAPVILVMFPVYFLTGCTFVPTGLFLETFSWFLYIAGFFYLTYRLALLDKKPFCFFQWLFLSIMAFLCSMGLSFVVYRWTDWKYRLPFTFGLAFIAFFLALVIHGYQDKKKRIYLFGLAGFFYVAIVASRPDFGIVALIALPFLIKGLLDKEIGLSKRILDLVPMAVLILSGAVLLMCYNYFRFGSVIQFGQSYQLTVSDQGNASLSFDGIFASFFHYYLEPFGFSSSFPYLTITKISLPRESNSYVQGSIGVLFQPFFWSLFLFPYVFKRSEGWDKKWFLLAFLLAPIVLAYSIYCLGGVCARYMLAIYPLNGMLCFYLVYSFFNSAKEKESFRTVFVTCSILMFFGVYLMVNFAFNNFDGLQYGNAGVLSTWLREAF
ncbi:MAG: hypothetical protein LKJ81_04825 [Bacilli bacterium]|jgi:hypothetical protein|nr:hypothetical protein [Bacilli bacterium]MCI2055449.1 hypothetical protein [Bacilli bacterium]